MAGGGHGINLVALATEPTYAPIYSALLVATVVSCLFLIGRAQLATAKRPLVPDKRLSLRGITELLVCLILMLCDQVMGKENRKYVPFICTLFCYILFMNLLGLLPGFAVPTGNITINVGLALTVFVLYHYWGFRSSGVIGYLKHFWGPVWWLGFLLFPVELISHSVRPVSLSLRLFANMTADHILVQVFTELQPMFVPVLVMFLGLFVCCIQAFIFSLLSMIYIRLAVQHEH